MITLVPMRECLDLVAAARQALLDDPDRTRGAEQAVREFEQRDEARAWAYHQEFEVMQRLEQLLADEMDGLAVSGSGADYLDRVVLPALTDAILKGRLTRTSISDEVVLEPVFARVTALRFPAGPVKARRLS